MTREKYTYIAILKGGVELRAEKIKGRWLIGGDVVNQSLISFIKRSDGNEYILKGNRLVKL